MARALSPPLHSSSTLLPIPPPQTQTQRKATTNQSTSSSSLLLPPPFQSEVPLAAPPPFTLADIKAAIPAKCFEKNAAKSMAYLAWDVAVVVGLAAAALAVNTWWAWPLYWIAQGTMFWALFVVGHDCGHQSFSNNKALNDLVGNITHSSILVPYHGWRVSWFFAFVGEKGVVDWGVGVSISSFLMPLSLLSLQNLFSSIPLPSPSPLSPPLPPQISHRTHHSNHGHVENDESWHPVSRSLLDGMDGTSRAGRLSLPWAMFAFPFYLWKRSPGKEGSHYDPKCDLFVESEAPLVKTSNAFMIGMLGVLAASAYLWARSTCSRSTSSPTGSTSSGSTSSPTCTTTGPRTRTRRCPGSAARSGPTCAAA